MCSQVLSGTYRGSTHRLVRVSIHNYLHCSGGIGGGRGGPTALPNISTTGPQRNIKEGPVPYESSQQIITGRCPRVEVVGCVCTRFISQRQLEVPVQTPIEKCTADVQQRAIHGIVATNHMFTFLLFLSFPFLPFFKQETLQHLILGVCFYSDYVCDCSVLFFNYLCKIIKRYLM